MTLLADLRDDKQFIIDHPGAVPISTAQVVDSTAWTLLFRQCTAWFWNSLNSALIPLYVVCLKQYWLFMIIVTWLQGEELRKLIGAAAYIECSSKTQQVSSFFIHSLSFMMSHWILIYEYMTTFLCNDLQNVKAVFDAAIKVVLQPPKQKKKKKTSQKGCSIMWIWCARRTWLSILSLFDNGGFSVY